MNRFGGEMRFRLSTGEAVITRGTFEVMPTSINAASVINQDGSVSKTAELTGRRANLSFEDGGQDWDALVRADSFDASMVEDYTGTIHTFTDASFQGEASINRNTGELTGLSVISNAYRRVNG